MEVRDQIDLDGTEVTSDGSQFRSKLYTQVTPAGTHSQARPPSNCFVLTGKTLCCFNQMQSFSCFVYIWIRLTSGIFQIKFKFHTVKHDAYKFKFFW